MKDIYVAFGKYNKKTNEIICGYLAQNKIEDIFLGRDSYYPSVIDSVLHVLKSDYKWFTRLSVVTGKNYLEGMRIEFIDSLTKESVMSDEGILPEIIETRKAVDEKIIEFVASIDQRDFDKNFEVPFGKGVIHKRLWQLLMQWFNHQTHHRGQISLQLELIGQENDYSGVIGKIED